MPRKKRPEHIGSSLNAIVSKLAPEGHLQIVRLMQAWPDVVGDAIARRTEITSLKFHTAVIKVSRAMWIQELSLMKPQILQRLVAKLGDDSVCDIRFVMGALSRRSSPRRKPSLRATRRTIDLPELKDPEL